MKQTEHEQSQRDYRKLAEYQAAEAFLMGRINYERMPKMPYSRREMNLVRTSRLLELLNNPHEKVDLVHVAGTKGKGSTVALLASVLGASGLQCGSYTSPHLHHVEERFRLNGVPCTPEEFVALVETVRPVVAQLDAEGPEYHATYFEIATALGFLYFVHQEMDVAIVEVGLGGRLDSTNVCSPLVSVITSISLDHTKQLGNTLGLIAREKAGIIKTDVPVVSGVTSPEPRDVIRGIATERMARLFEQERDFRVAEYHPASCGNQASVTIERFANGQWQPALSDVELTALGKHQAANASVAWATLDLLPDRLKPGNTSIRQGFNDVKCEGRIEIVARHPLVIVDTAHNPASASALADTLEEFEVSGRRWLILAATRGKDVKDMLDFLLPQFNHVVCTKYEKNPRAFDVQQLMQMTMNSIATNELQIQAQHCDRPQDAWELVKSSATTDDCICITGSFFIAAELRELLLE